MDWFSFLITGVMIYVALAVLIGGLGYKIYYWLGTAKTPVNLGIFPKPKSKQLRFFKLIKDSFAFPQSIKVDVWMWVFAIVFHFALLGAFVGHLRLIHEFTPLVSALGPEGMDQFAFIGGGSAGILLTLALLYYLLRRFASPYKDLSVPEDYLLVALILLIVTTGNHMRFFGHIPVTAYREYVSSLFTLRPAFTDILATSTMKWSFVVHLFFVNLLFIYFPFSKLTHAIGTFAANLIRSE